MVVDADGLTLLVNDESLRDLLQARRAAGRVTVITPHAGEFARLGLFCPKADRRTASAPSRTLRRSLAQLFYSKGTRQLLPNQVVSAFVNTLVTRHRDCGLGRRSVGIARIPAGGRDCAKWVLTEQAAAQAARVRL